MMKGKSKHPLLFAQAAIQQTLVHTPGGCLLRNEGNDPKAFAAFVFLGVMRSFAYSLQVAPVTLQGQSTGPITRSKSTKRREVWPFKAPKNRVKRKATHQT